MKHVETRAEDIFAMGWPGPCVRVISTINGFRQQFGRWPTAVRMDSGMLEGLKKEILTPRGWKMLAGKVKLSGDAEGTVIAEGDAGECFEYEGGYSEPEKDCRSDLWIWGVEID
ncbi:hypothetical protein [Mariprofundus ferrooxydans]|uniref:hypothetical protein n=1 Tax=Mariprofundus ferrooxydans TaxID=314344 RepID=UPI00035EE3B5|nr:hypothetical protein [Mariprofundus ferrooxydans]